MLIGAFGDPTRIVRGRCRPDAAQRSPPRSARSPRRSWPPTPLIFAGLAVAVSFRSGVFNIGVEGQFILGAFGATIAAIAAQGAAGARAHPDPVDRCAAS